MQGLELGWSLHHVFVAFRVRSKLDSLLFPPPYPGAPSSQDEHIAAAIRAAAPEEIRGLSWTKPDFAASGHKIIRKFDIEGKRRPDGRYIPCAMCSNNHPKFLSGSVLWSPDGWLRLIGHVCAANDEHFGEEGYRRLLKQLDQEELDNITLEWMEANVAALKPIAASMTTFLQALVFWEDQQRIFFHGVGDLATMLVKITRYDGGILSLVQESSEAHLVTSMVGSVTTERGNYETVTVGMLSGSLFLDRPKRGRSRQLAGLLEAFARVPDGTGEDQLLGLIDRGGEQEITITTAIVFRALQGFGKLANEYADASLFVSDKNLEVLGSWGADNRNSRPLRLHRNAQRVTFVLQDGSRATISTKWPTLPNMSMLRSIVTNGLQLDGALKNYNR
jgi:hypothetical protein